MTDPDDDAADVFLLDTLDPDEETADVFLLDALDSDDDTADVSIGMSVVLECCDGVTDVCVKTLLGLNVTPGKIVLNIGSGRTVAIGSTFFIVSAQVFFFTIFSEITTPMILNDLRSSRSIFKCYHQLCY